MRKQFSSEPLSAAFRCPILEDAAIRGKSYSAALTRRGRDRSGILAALLGAVAGLGLSDDARAFTIVESPTAPTTNVIASQTTDQSATLIGSQDYTDNGGPPGQTFVVGGTGNFQMQAFTILGGGGHGGTSSASSGINWSIQIGSVDLATGAITQLSTETSLVTYTSNADYLTFGLDTPVTLSAGTTYAFSIYSSAGWYGLAHSSSDVYAGGTAFNNDLTTTQLGNEATRRAFNGFVSPRAYDYVFTVQGLSLATGKIWSGSVNGNWNTTTNNFTGLAYAEGENVTFRDVDAAGSTPPATRNVTIQTGGVSPGTTMTVSNSTGDYTFTGTINGATNQTVLVKSGTGAATLAGTTDNPGLTANVNEGTLLLGKTSSATVHALGSFTVGPTGTARLTGTGGDQIADSAVVSVSGVLDLNGKTESFDALAGSGTGSVTNSATTPATLTLGTMNGGGTFPGIISNGATSMVSLVKAGTGVATLSGLNTFTGGTTVNAGTLTLSLGGNTGTLAPNSPVTVNANGTLRLAVTDALGFYAGSTAPVSLNGGTVTTAAGTHATLPGITLTGGTVTSAGPGNFGTNTSSYIFDGPIITQASPTVSTVNAQGIALRGNLNGTTGASPVTFNVARGSGPIDLMVSSSIEDSGQGLIKAGAGIAVFSAPSVYTGPTSITAGTLSVTNSQALGTGPVMLTGGTLQLAGGPASIGINFNGGGTGSPTVAGAPVTGVAGVFPMTNWNNVDGATGAAIALKDSNGLAGVANLDSFTSTNTWSTGSGNALLNGYLDNTSTNPETVTVTGVPYGSYSVYAYFGSDAANRTGTISLDATTYFYNTRGNVGNYVLTTDTTGAVNPQANYAIFSNLTANTFTLTQIRGSGNSGLMGVEIVQNGVSPSSLANAVNVTSDSKIDVTGANAGGISGKLSIGANLLSITGGGSGANAAYNLSLGTVGGVSLGGSPTFNVARNGTGAGVLTLGAITETAPSGITKTNDGTLILTGASTYTGATAVNGGALIVSGSIAGTSGVTVATGATLGGAGSITTANAITAATGARLAPGAQLLSPGTLTITASMLDLVAELTGSSQSLLFDLGTAAASSKVVLSSGALSIGTGKLAFGDFQFQADAGFAQGTYTLFDTSSPISGTLNPVANNLTGVVGSLSATLALADSGRDIVLIVIPEPGSASALFGGLGMLIGLGRMRRRLVPGADV